MVPILMCLLSDSSVPVVGGAGRDEEHYFYLYRISYAWTSLLGWTATTSAAAVLEILARLAERIRASQAPSAV